MQWLEFLFWSPLPKKISDGKTLCKLQNKKTFQKRSISIFCDPLKSSACGTAFMLWPFFSISFLPWQISPAEQGGVGRNTIQSGFDFLFSSFPLSSFGLRRTEKEYKQTFSSRCPGILWRKHLFCKFCSVVLLPLKIFQPPVPRKRQAFGGIVCNAGKAAPVKNRSRILLHLQ